MAVAPRAFHAADVCISHGQCVNQYGPGEAYLPVLETLGRLGRGVRGAEIRAVLQQQAPSWLVHLPALLAPEDRERLERTAGGAAQARMLRELADALEIQTATCPLVLVLEDLNWSDRATLERSAYVVRRRDPARVLILGKYRPLEVIVQAHPLRPLLAELCPHASCAELVLDYLFDAAVTEYLRQRFGVTLIPQYRKPFDLLAVTNRSYQQTKATSPPWTSFATSVSLLKLRWNLCCQTPADFPSHKVVMGSAARSRSDNTAPPSHR
jgi:hypothetical protein